MTERSLHCPDVTLAGTVTGQGPPAVLLHAGGERRQVWLPVAQALAQAGCSSVEYDLRGHGESGHARSEELASHAADVRRMITTIEAAPVLVGASLGGMAAMLALHDAAVEGRVAGLVLVDVVPDPPPDSTRRYLAQTAESVAYHPLVEDILGRSAELRAAARGLRLPVLLVRGGEGSILTDADVARFVELVPHAQLARVDRGGHLVARDAPVQLAAHLVGHLQDASVRRRRIGRFLDDVGAAETPHPGGTLLAHLHRTGDLLESWGAAAWVVDAARVHAAYGTDGFAPAMAGVDRQALIAVAGARSEELVARYGNCSREQSYPTFVTDAPALIDRRTGRRTPLDQPELRAFIELTMANEIDVFAHAPEVAAAHGAGMAALFRRWLPLVGEPARMAALSLSNV